MTARSKNSVKFLTAVACDEARREDNGKEFLIGIYSGTIATKSLPRTLTLSFWIPTEVTNPGEYNVQFQLLNTDNKIVQTTPAIKMTIPQDNFGASIVLGKIQIKVPKPGTLKLMGSVDGGKWISIKKIPIEVNGGIKN